MPALTIETLAGEPLHSGSLVITPFAQTARLQLPGLPGGLIWSRPVAVLVQQADGQEYTLPVRDVTREAQITLLGGAALLGLLLCFFRSRAAAGARFFEIDGD